jgi:hypothetical protein
LCFWILSPAAGADCFAFWFWFSGFSLDLLRSIETKAYIPTVVALFDFFGLADGIGFSFQICWLEFSSLFRCR